MSLACISIGSNLQDPHQQILAAIEQLSQIDHTQLDRVSGLYTTKPWGLEEQPDFINAAAGLQTRLTPHELLRELQTIEFNRGRTRTHKWGPRILDLDIICYDQVMCKDPDLQLPHPLFNQRLFVLVPLSTIYPEVVVDGISIQQWLTEYAGKNPDSPMPIPVPASQHLYDHV